MFCVTKNIQIIVFRNDEDVFDRLIIAFILSVAIKNYCFFFDIPLLSFLDIDTFPKKSSSVFYFMHRINCYWFQPNRVIFMFFATYLLIYINLSQYIFSLLMVIFQVSKECSMIHANQRIDIFKEQVKKTKVLQYPEFHVTNLQLNKLHKIQVSVTVSVMLFLMTLWD